jgi:hypothetical protein
VQVSRMLQRIEIVGFDDFARFVFRIEQKIGLVS